MDGSIRFRFAGREDIPLILRFIKCGYLSGGFIRVS